MHITRTNPNSTETKLIIKAEAAELAKAKALVIKKLAPQVKVPGFRAGHVPPAIIEKNIDQNVLQSEVIEETLNKLYGSAVRQEQLRPVANPEVAIKKFVPFTELEVEFTVATIGVIKLADYKKVKLAKPAVKVEAKDVDDVIKSLQSRAADMKPVERAAKSGDQVVMDFKGTDSKGEPVNGADGKEYPLILGSNAFIPGFEENLVGLKKDDTKTFTITFPKDYGVSALQSKKVTFEVNVKQVNEVNLAKVDDDFAAAVGPFKTLTELKADIKKQLLVEREREGGQVYENELLERIAEKSTVEIPDLLINDQIDRLENEERQNLTYRGQTWEDHLKEEGVTAEEHRTQKRPAAEQRLKVSILLSEIAEAEGIEVTPEELEVRLQIMKGQYRDAAAQAELNTPEALRDIQSRMMAEKTIAKLTSYASAI